ncbi:MAG TPA: hypothetical protein VL371_25880 [Gemmataceae bacterium]|jgi:hypothetical protein|nr:hypothetical protein [Gemmataceae bacterium]
MNPNKFILDENTPGPRWRAILLHNANSSFPIDAVRVGDSPDLPLQSPDPDILIWAERNDRILISGDKRTMLGHMADHLSNGRHSPGVIILKSKGNRAFVSDLEAIAHASDPDERLDMVRYFP